MALIKIEDIQTRFLSKDLQLITEGDTAVIERAINSAVIWLKANLSKTGIAFNENDSFQKEVAIKRALYELYAYAQDWEMAKENKEDAESMFYARFTTPEGKTIKNTVAAVVEGSDNWKGFK